MNPFSRKISSVFICILLNGCALFEKKSQDGESETNIDARQLIGNWVETKEFDLLNKSSKELLESDAQILIFTGTTFSRIQSVQNQSSCTNKKSFKISRQTLIFDDASEKPLVVKGVEKNALSLLELGSTGIPIYERMFAKVSDAKLKQLFMASSNNEICPAFLGYTSSSDQDGTMGNDVFRPNIDLGSEYTKFIMSSDLLVSGSSSQSDIGYLRFVRESGDSFKPGSQPKLNPYCEFTFINIGQITKSGADHLIRAGLAFKVVRVSRSKLSGGKSSIDILFDGLQVQCIHPNSENGLSNSDLVRCIGPEIQIF